MTGFRYLDRDGCRLVWPRAQVHKRCLSKRAPRDPRNHSETERTHRQEQNISLEYYSTEWHTGYVYTRKGDQRIATPVPAVAQGGMGLSPAGSCLATGSLVETPWEQQNRTVQGGCGPLGNVCSASSRRRRWRFSANGSGLVGSVGLGINLAVERGLRLTVGSIGRGETGGVE